MSAAPEAPAPKTSGPTRGRIFVRRLGSTAALWAVVLWTVFSTRRDLTDWVFLGMLMGLTWVGMREFYGWVGRLGKACFPGWGVGLGLGIVTVPYLGQMGILGGGDLEGPAMALAFLALCARRFLARDVTDGLAALATTWLGLLYVPWLLNFMARIVLDSAIDGRCYLLYFILVTKFSDLGAYVTGSLIGRHKMIPRISPGKTWEGFAGAIAFSTGASLAFTATAGDRLAGMTLMHAALLGILLSVSAVLGDLVESQFKREAGVKDSGQWFPGIGGVLDLVDSLLFNAPLMYLYLRFVLT
ncbi:MAG: phosphatidate cytidylyltransferase [Verrucomicrobiae bacterium]|nr:phosphatidate cytidylyltransferase [Verrucomicrobiae bacterium]